MESMTEKGAEAPPSPSWAALGDVLPLEPSPFTNNPFPVFQRHDLFDPSTRYECTTNARAKIYPQKAVVQVANSDVFAVSDYEFYNDDSRRRKRPYEVPSKGNAADPERSLQESQRRAVSKIRDIALCNRFTHMFTWTLDPDLIDRYDAQAIYKKLRDFLSNTSRRKGFQYVLIPEYHKKKDGEERPAIHMHGLCVLGDVRISRAHGKDEQPLFDDSGREIFNMLDWKLGFSTCVPLDGEYEKAVNYACKYITKSEEKIFGKWYLSSRSLKKSPDIVPLARIDFDSFVDIEKMQNKEQFVTNIYRDVMLVSEDHVF